MDKNSYGTVLDTQCIFIFTIPMVNEKVEIWGIMKMRTWSRNRDFSDL